MAVRWRWKGWEGYPRRLSGWLAAGQAPKFQSEPVAADALLPGKGNNDTDNLAAA